MLNANLIGNLGSDPEIVEIPLTKGKTAVVDQQDGHLAAFNWCAIKRAQTWYAVRSVGPHGRQRTVFMHRVILGAPDQIKVDHRDHDGLNNRRGNLRLATISQNNANSRRPKARSGFRGVVAHGRRWRAQIRDGGQRQYLGFFDAPEQAARAYDDAAVRLHGEFATLNFPEAV